MLCDDLEGWDDGSGRREAEEEGGVRILMADSHWCTAEDRNVHVAVGTDLSHTGNLTIINGDKTGKVSLPGRKSHSWGEASESVYY